MAAGDPRPSLEERYGSHAGYVSAVRKAADAAVTAKFLLPDDANDRAECLQMADFVAKVGDLSRWPL